MRYIDVDVEGITQNLLAADLVFKTQRDSLINLSDNYSGNLTGATNINEAMSILDSFTGGDGTGVVTESDPIARAELTRTINNINDMIVAYDGALASTHIFTHNLDTEFLKCTVWVNEDQGWQNSIVPITIIDPNTIRVEVSYPKEVRIIVQNINDISKTYGI